VDPDALSDDPAGDRQDGLAPEVERLGVVRARSGPVDILLRRSAGPDGAWTFAPRTVARVPALYEEFGYGVIESILPPPLVEIRVLEVALWQWIALLLLVAVAWGGVVGRRRRARTGGPSGRGAIGDQDRRQPGDGAHGTGPGGAGAGLLRPGVLALGLPLPLLGLITSLGKVAVILVAA
jgi:hypothetical protein